MAMKDSTFKGTATEWFQGADAYDVIGGLAGIGATATVPAMIVKAPAEGAELTTNQKLLKIGVALVTTAAVGSIGRSMINASAGKAAVIGGLAGTASQAIAAFTGYQIGRRPVGRALPAAVGRPRSIGAATTVSPASNRETERVSVIRP